MPYTPLSQIERQRALAQTLRQQPRDKATGTLGGLAYMLRQYGAGRGEALASEREEKNQAIQRRDMNSLVSALRSGDFNERQVTGIDGELLGTIPGKRAQFESPEVQSAYTNSLLAQELARSKAAADAKQNPYFTPVYTQEGIGSFNNRAGTVDMIMGQNGQPLIRSTDDPGLQGRIAGSKQQGEKNVDLTMNPQIESKTTTAKIEAELDKSDEVADAAAAEESKVTQAEEEVKTAQALKRLQNEYEAKLTNTARGITNIIEEARKTLTGDIKPTSSGLGTLADKAASLVGVAPEGAKEAARLRAIGGALVAKMPRMEGPQSDYDVQNYIDMAGRVGDSTIPLESRIEALKIVEDLWAKYEKPTDDGGWEDL